MRNGSICYDDNAFTILSQWCVACDSTIQSFVNLGHSPRMKNNIVPTTLDDYDYSKEENVMNAVFCAILFFLKYVHISYRICSDFFRIFQFQHIF